MSDPVGSPNCWFSRAMTHVYWVLAMSGTMALNPKMVARDLKLSKLATV